MKLLSLFRDENAFRCLVLSRARDWRLKLQELAERGGTQLLMQGGLNQQLGIEYFEEIFTRSKDVFHKYKITHYLQPRSFTLPKFQALLLIPPAKAA